MGKVPKKLYIRDLKREILFLIKPILVPKITISSHNTKYLIIQAPDYYRFVMHRKLALLIVAEYEVSHAHAVDLNIFGVKWQYIIVVASQSEDEWPVFQLAA